MSEKTGPLHLEDDDFEKNVLQNPLPVMVDFWAPRCGPCRFIAPVIEELANEYAGRVQIAKLDVDQHQRWAAKLGIQGIPTLIFFKNGEEVGRVVGAVPKKTLQAHLDALL